MTREGAIQLACLYGPLAGAALLAWWIRPGKWLSTGLLFSLSWNATMLPWWPRWRPRVGEPCELWLDQRCGPCSEVARWFLLRQPHRLELRDANAWTGPPLLRVTSRHPSSGRRESGVRAIAMALQHLSLPWALIGWVAGLPGISHSLQICLDAAGTAKR